MTFTPQWYWFLHHEIPLEQTTEPVENRIAYIRSDKPSHEVATRLAALQPVKNPARALALWAEYERQRDPLVAEYERQHAPLWAEYERQRDTLVAPLMALYLEEYPECAPLVDVARGCLRFPEAP